ncbi:hypothetical protein ACPOL_0297 [Acidisarcina polymorpha]|uniref:Uncharacterized protein n=1 Tax=Acidisarcina polymorpha TaxID=2211140 RepID=A0A2Z5FSB4_9BACT|nr:hypothetical protein ACPOL_0297 [Acidisarcina polymorpha]
MDKASAIAAIANADQVGNAIEESANLSQIKDPATETRSKIRANPGRPAGNIVNIRCTISSLRAWRKCGDAAGHGLG